MVCYYVFQLFNIYYNVTYTQYIFESVLCMVNLQHNI